MPKLTIDGIELEVPAGENLIHAARRIGKEVPHFCWHEKLSIAANCRMCLVEIEKNPKLQPACQQTAADGMVVHTQSKKAVEARAAVMEFLLINHPLDCPICDKAGECMLQDNYMGHDGQNSRQTEYKMSKPRLEVLGPLVNYNAERCIMCTRCVRFMDEVPKNTQLGAFNRGDRSVIGTFPGKPLDDPYSLNVVELCPVGALGNLDFRFNSRVWQLNKTHTVCGGCAKGCNTEAHHKNGTMYRMIPRTNDAVNSAWMCDEGRLSYKSHNDNRALVAGKSGVETPVNEVIVGAKQAFADMRKSAGEGWIIFISPNLTLEGAYAWLATAKTLAGKAKWFVSGRPDGVGDNLLRRADKNGNRTGLTTLAQALSINLGTFADGVAAVKSAGAKAKLFVLGTDTPDASLDALIAKADQSVVLGAHQTQLFESAKWALPLASHFEESGSFMNEDKRIQRLRPTNSVNANGQTGWSWLVSLATGLEGAPVWQNAESVFADIARQVPGFAGLTLTQLGPLGRAFGSGTTGVTDGVTNASATSSAATV